ncbi:MAG TPA: indolepyruvate ferredoxin oxidoreductase subunit alpha [Armatimonadota bacterium]
MKELLSGNEAIARGAWEHGVTVAAAYPGTPSTEILENIALHPEIAAQWSPNEKVALEVAIGASLAGARSLAAMKHVGVNVAADPLLTLAYTGVNGGLVLVSADDPGIHSSQNEQDNRFYGRFARIPVLEPSDSQEAKDFVGVALEMSEQLDTVVLLRSTTRISHSKSLVTLGERVSRPLRPYVKNARKYVMVPGNARARQPEVLARFDRMVVWAESAPVNRVEPGDRRLGIITSGVCYQYVKEARPDVSVLKLGVTYPLPANLVREFAKTVDQVAVIEELEPFLAESVRLAGVEIADTGLPRIGELSPDIVGAAIARILGEPVDAPFAPPAAVPVRPPVLCPGCPHRGVFHVLGKLKLRVWGDIGCYTLAALPPLNAMDAFMDMGASIGMALGMEKADPAMAQQSVAVIGDSTFLHSGLTGLLDMVYNQSRGTVLILDNSTTAMTGHQDHPATGKTLQGAETYQADLEQVCRGLGVRRVRVVDALDVDALEVAVREETKQPEVSVIIARRACVLLHRPDGSHVELDVDLCTGCQQCSEPGCPAIRWEEGHPAFDVGMCDGCGLCVSLCLFDAIKKVEPSRG